MKGGRTAPRRAVSDRQLRRNGARRSKAGAPRVLHSRATISDAPQWSPPMKGGSTTPTWLARHGRRIGRNGARRRKAGAPSTGTASTADVSWAAMEPADERREHLRRTRPASARAAAAMEPAHERREHWLRPAPPITAHGPAAMEPAHERREHRYVDRAHGRGDRPPQWSPPTKGGSTAPATRC